MNVIRFDLTLSDVTFEQFVEFIKYFTDSVVLELENPLFMLDLPNSSFVSYSPEFKRMCILCQDDSNVEIYKNAFFHSFGIQLP